MCTHRRDICLLKSRIWLFPTSTDAALPVKNELIQVEKGGVWMKEAVFGSSVSVVLNSEWLNGSQKKKKKGSPHCTSGDLLAPVLWFRFSALLRGYLVLGFMWNGPLIQNINRSTLGKSACCIPHPYCTHTRSYPKLKSIGRQTSIILYIIKYLNFFLKCSWSSFCCSAVSSFYISFLQSHVFSPHTQNAWLD